jgi:phage tail-like protein
MDVNNSRYHALVTQADWEKLLPQQIDDRDLEWTEGGRSILDSHVCKPGAGGLALKALMFEFKPGRWPKGAGEASPPFADTSPPTDPVLLTEQTGRGGVFDAYGNLYSISANRRALRVRSVGSGAMSDFWPATGTVAGGTARDGVGAIAGLTAGQHAARPGSTQVGGFGPVSPESAPRPVRLDAIAVTTGRYLVAASVEAGGLLIFDLHGAGPPLFQAWPGLGRLPGTYPSFAPAVVEALVALEDGGLGALIDGWLWRVGADLKPRIDVASTPAAFKPAGTDLAGGSPPSADTIQPAAAVPSQPCLLDLRPALGADARVTAVAALRGERLLVVGHGEDDPNRLRAGVIHLNGGVIPVIDGRYPDHPVAAPALNRFIASIVMADPDTGERTESPPADSDTGERAEPPLASRTLAVDFGAATLKADQHDVDFSFVVLAAGGDQAFRFSADWRDGALAIDIERIYLPMRRYLGMGLAALPAGMKLRAYSARVFYAADERWAPLLGLPQPRYKQKAAVVAPVWDSHIPGCVWHRLALDMRLPAGTRVEIETRAADNAADLPSLTWRLEPGPARAPRGSELPWRDSSAAGDPSSGTWVTLPQAAHGRYFQARITLAGDGKQTPLLRALRVWYPRFSYAREYLPPVFREDPVSADFLDRLLALFEGEFTHWEDRIAAAQWLFDARTAPAKTLEWLAGWLGLAFDPATTDETRCRLLVRYAMTGYARRGTVPGLLLSATLAWETSTDENWLIAPERLAERPHGLRLQEMFGLVTPLPPGAWKPAQGRSALLARLDANDSLVDPDALTALAAAQTGASAASGFSAGGTAATTATATTARHARLLGAFGFIPRAAIEEARLWASWTAAQQALAAGGSTSSSLIPTDEPTNATARTAWTTYLAASQPCAPLRQRWQDFLARRWRRVSALNAAWGTRWRDFDRIPSPVEAPAADAALADWHRFEAQVLRGLAGAHRFRIVLPLPTDGNFDFDELARRRAAVLRVVEREKPAHTVAEVRFGFDLFRVGAARLGLDTRLETGLARRPELAVLGRIDLGGASLAPTRPQPPADRIGLDSGKTFTGR